MLGELENNDLMKKFVSKSVELDLLKKVSRKHEETLGQKKEELSQEKKKLDKLHYQLWNQNDKFCETVWSFSREHNYPDYINQQLDIPVHLPRKKQQNGPQIIENMQKEIGILTEDIRILEDELSKKPEQKISKFVYKTPRNLKLKPSNTSSCLTGRKKE